MKDKHLQYTIQYNQIMIHHLLHLVILLIVLLIIHLDRDLPQSAIPPILTINTLHTNPITNVTTSRTLSRPPIPLIQNNPLSYNLTSTNTQFSSNFTQSNLNIQHLFYSLSGYSYYYLQTLQPVQAIPIQPQINVPNPSTSFNPSTTHTIPPTTIPLSTLNTPTYIVSATSISEPNKPFDGLDHNYRPEEYLQHIEARVTFSLGLQPPAAHE